LMLHATATPDSRIFVVLPFFRRHLSSAIGLCRDEGTHLTRLSGVDRESEARAFREQQQPSPRF